MEISSYTLFAIFDGVSSLSNAKHGVNLALRELKRIYNKTKYDADIDLVKILNRLNNKVAHSNYDKPYSTCTLLAIPKRKSNSIKVASLGDSRVYGIHKQFVKQITEDHNVEGQPGVITHYLGMEHLELSNIFYKEVDEQFSDFILCTDGFCALFEKDISKYHDIILRNKPATAVNTIRKEIQGSNQDDASFIHVRAQHV